MSTKARLTAMPRSSIQMQSCINVLHFWMAAQHWLLFLDNVQAHAPLLHMDIAM